MGVPLGAGIQIKWIVRRDSIKKVVFEQGIKRDGRWGRRIPGGRTFQEAVQRLWSGFVLSMFKEEQGGQGGLECGGGDEGGWEGSKGQGGVRVSSKRPGPRGSKKTEEDFVGCSGKFGSLREMRTLWRIIKITGYQMVLMA